MTGAVVVFAVLVLGFAAVTRGLGRLSITAPIIFLGVGAALAAVSPFAPETLREPLTILAEVTLALILFHDASQVRPREIKRDPGPAVRLLLIGLPLTMLLGYGLALIVLPGTPVMFALLLAAALAPTDAGLGAATVLNPVVPVRVRRLLNVESGLNDGLATPVVLFAIAAIAGTEGLGVGESVAQAVVELVLGVVVGIAVGAGGGALLRWSDGRGLSSTHSRRIGVLAMPVLAYFGADLAGVNAFVASFVAGMALAGVLTWEEEESSPTSLTEALSEPLGYAVWLAFGVGVVPLIVSEVGWREVLYAVLALTVIRMVPVALSLLGSGFAWPTVAFVGWFGPRGLASVVFALLALESLDDDVALRRIVATIACTVVISVFAHGLTASPLANRYGAWCGRSRRHHEGAPASEPRRRRSMMLR
ncbi:sodium:proton antiporter [Nostocoides sp. F2B08]|uniref:cation:proton antiporter n=1 Tax=Nostocoides sp. F2B08 TaxID=2653936 RepID=UPI001263927A|nr:cation:proton antiporter [Tetrasphaera sp. F2B08]KAB7745700.1 sodium:proton antiporter [Tetrasphaera sp. F2B08]